MILRDRAMGHRTRERTATALERQTVIDSLSNAALKLHLRHRRTKRQTRLSVCVFVRLFVRLFVCLPDYRPFTVITIIFMNTFNVA